MDVPLFVKSEFGKFYRDMFAQQVKKEDMRVVFLEYAWNMGWCDPCAADPLTADELRELGVHWGGGQAGRGDGASAGNQVYVTRLHLRYDAEHFPDDLVFQETRDTGNFQGRYVLRHPWTGETKCSAAERYWKGVRDRQEREATTLAALTGWDMAAIRGKIDFVAPGATEGGKWWDRLWPD